MFVIFFLLSINYTILRSLRSTLAVVGLGTGAHLIPYFELFGVLPAALGITWLLGKLLNRYSFKAIFISIQSLFLLFFVIFSGPCYPFFLTMKGTGPMGESIVFLASLSFHVMAELWKPILATILFWGLINQSISKDLAKKIYAPLMLGGSLGAIVASQLIGYCTQVGFSWSYALSAMVGAIVIIGCVTIFLYIKLFTLLKRSNLSNEESRLQLSGSLTENISGCMNHPKLRLLAWITIADYIAYTLGEVIFLDALKYRFPEPNAYCHYLGTLQFWGGGLTVLFSLVVAPYLLQKCRWVVPALATPVCLLVTQGCFFTLLEAQDATAYFLGWNQTDWMACIIFVGSVQFCLCRAAKLTLLDSSKELAFVFMSREEKIRGKLVIDGLCSRVGRGSASLLSLGFAAIAGGALASSTLSGLTALSMGATWLLSTMKLGRLMEKSSIQINASDP